MRRMLKDTAPFELKVQQVEDLMNELGVRLHYNGIGMVIEDTEVGQEYDVCDSDSGPWYSHPGAQTFPRQFESERLYLPDEY